MSWVRIWVHMVFSTKERTPYLKSIETREKVLAHIVENAKEKEIWLDSLGGYSEHIHCLVSLGRQQTISKVAQLIKGESSFWINRNKITTQKFMWQDDFWAVSASESHIEKVRKYIRNQDEHHRKKSFDEEIEEFMKKYNWSHVTGK